jgi:predicted nucleic acid-binding protein
LIYLDSSVALAQLFGEGRGPPETLWAKPLVSSRLLEYEVWTRVNSHRFADVLRDAVDELLGRLRLVELSEAALARAIEPWPLPMRTLDALHLATMQFLRGRGEAVELASYDGRLVRVAQALDFVIAAL